MAKELKTQKESKPRNLKVVVAVGLVAAVALMGIAFALPKMMGDPEPEAPLNAGGAGAGAPVPGTAAGLPVPPADAAPSTAASPGADVSIASLKDPFKPLVASGPVAPAPAVLAVAPPPPPPPVVAVPPAPVAAAPAAPPAAPPAPEAPAAAPAPPAAPGPQSVTLLDTFYDSSGRVRASIKVGSTVQNVAEGDMFSEVYKLVSIREGCASISRGSDVFTLCEGQETVK